MAFWDDAGNWQGRGESNDFSGSGRRAEEEHRWAGAALSVEQNGKSPTLPALPKTAPPRRRTETVPTSRRGRERKATRVQVRDGIRKNRRRTETMSKRPTSPDAAGGRIGTPEKRSQCDITLMHAIMSLASSVLFQSHLMARCGDVTEQ